MASGSEAQSILHNQSQVWHHLTQICSDCSLYDKQNQSFTALQHLVLQSKASFNSKMKSNCLNLIHCKFLVMAQVTVQEKKRLTVNNQC